MMTRDLERSTEQLVVHGKIIFNLRLEFPKEEETVSTPKTSESSPFAEKVPKPTILPTGTQREGGVFTDKNGTRLPAGWERREDHVGRAYYVNHNTRDSTWISPVIK